MDKFSQNKFFTLFLILCVTVAFTIVPVHMAHAAVILQILAVIVTAVVVAVAVIATGGAAALLAGGIGATVGVWAAAVAIDCALGIICHGGGDGGSGSGGSGSGDTGGGTNNGVSEPSCSFSTNQAQVYYPNSATLSWNCSSADTCSIDNGVGSVNAQSGSVNVAPANNTTYKLVCNNAGYTNYSPDPVTVTVAYHPVCSFSVDHTKIVLPQKATLSWTCQYADTCALDQGIGSVDKQSGSHQVAPTENTTYILTCSNASYSTNSTQSISVSVSSPYLCSNR